MPFQFQYGAIKREDAGVKDDVFNTFQFQYGAIKRPFSFLLAKAGSQSVLFQFQYGAIKSIIRFEGC